jgi:hypothetical protein
MIINRTLAVLLLSLWGIISLRAQPAAVQQLQNIQQARQQQQILPPALAAGTNAPELYPGENEDIGPQRILRLNPRPDYFDVVADSQIFYTDNANFATGTNSIGSAVFVNTIQAAFTPPAMKFGPGKFAPTIGVASQWYNYWNNKISSLDFQAQTLFVGGKYVFNNWEIGVGGNYTRLLNQSDYVQTYSEFMPALGVQRIFPIGNKMLLAIGDQIDYHFTEVPPIGVPANINDRFDDNVYLTFSWQMTRHLVLQPYYRFQYSNYQHNTALDSDRNDYLHTFGVSLIYYINKNVSLRAFFNYSQKNSDDPFTPAYHEYDGGIGASVDFRF